MSPEELIAQLRSLLQAADSSLGAEEARKIWSDRLQQAMQTHPEAKTDLGKLRGELMRYGRSLAHRIEVDWCRLGPGRLAIGHRPGRKLITGLPMAGATHVVTLLSETEGAESIGRDVQRAGLAWIWLPMNSGEPPAPDRFEQMHATHALLRLRGLEPQDAILQLGRLRSVTATGVGARRLAWGHQFAPKS